MTIPDININILPRRWTRFHQVTSLSKSGLRSKDNKEKEGQDYDCQRKKYSKHDECNYPKELIKYPASQKNHKKMKPQLSPHAPMGIHLLAELRKPTYK